MAGRLLDTSRTGPAHGGLRFPFFAALVLVLGACASGPEPVPEETPPPLADRTEESAYGLGEAEEKISQAESLEAEGKRGLAVLVLDTAQEMLPDASGRERAYIEILKATMWARPGEKRDAEKASALLKEVADDPRWKGDARLHSDVHLSRVVLHLADGDVFAGARSAESALAGLMKVEAYGQYARTARRLARQFLDVGDSARARDYAQRAHGVACRLDDDEARLQAALTAGEIAVVAGGEPEHWFLDAYESAYRMGSYAWRNVVVATVVGAYFAVEKYDACVKWGDRVRGRDRGLLPAPSESGLWDDDYLVFLAQYLHALEGSGHTGARYEETGRMILEMLGRLPDGRRAAWGELEEKLRADLLQPDGEK